MYALEPQEMSDCLCHLVWQVLSFSLDFAIAHSRKRPNSHVQPNFISAFAKPRQDMCCCRLRLFLFYLLPVCLCPIWKLRNGIRTPSVCLTFPETPWEHHQHIIFSLFRKLFITKWCVPSCTARSSPFVVSQGVKSPVLFGGLIFPLPVLLLEMKLDLQWILRLGRNLHTNKSSLTKCRVFSFSK